MGYRLYDAFNGEWYNDIFVTREEAIADLQEILDDGDEWLISYYMEGTFYYANVDDDNDIIELADVIGG